MCTVIVAPGLEGGTILAANRDEMLARPWEPPAEYWPGIIGGRDTLAGGTWLALNRFGVVAAVLNRHNTLGQVPGKRSRGELPLLALTQRTAATAAAQLAELDAGQWRGFNAVLADGTQAWFARGAGQGRVEIIQLLNGVSMITARDPNDLSSPRVSRHLPRFRATAPNFAAWSALLADRAPPGEAAINIDPVSGFGTVCSAFLTLGTTPSFRFAAGRPDEAVFTEIPPLAPERR